MRRPEPEKRPEPRGTAMWFFDTDVGKSTPREIFPHPLSGLRNTVAS
jgi:hypothetical protein